MAQTLHSNHVANLNKAKDLQNTQGNNKDHKDIDTAQEILTQLAKFYTKIDIFCKVMKGRDNKDIERYLDSQGHEEEPGPKSLKEILLSIIKYISHIKDTLFNSPKKPGIDPETIVFDEVKNLRTSVNYINNGIDNIDKVKKLIEEHNSTDIQSFKDLYNQIKDIQDRVFDQPKPNPLQNNYLLHISCAKDIIRDVISSAERFHEADIHLSNKENTYLSSDVNIKSPAISAELTKDSREMINSFLNNASDTLKQEAQILSEQGTKRIKDQQLKLSHAKTLKHSSEMSR